MTLFYVSPPWHRETEIRRIFEGTMTAVQCPEPWLLCPEILKLATRAGAGAMLTYAARDMMARKAALESYNLACGAVEVVFERSKDDDGRWLFDPRTVPDVFAHVVTMFARSRALCGTREADMHAGLETARKEHDDPWSCALSFLELSHNAGGMFAEAEALGTLLRWCELVAPGYVERL